MHTVSAGFKIWEIHVQEVWKQMLHIVGRDIFLTALNPVTVEATHGIYEECRY